MKSTNHIACLFLRERVYTHVNALGMTWSGLIGSISCVCYFPVRRCGYADKLFQPVIVDSHCPSGSDHCREKISDNIIDWGTSNSSNSLTVAAFAVQFHSGCTTYSNARKKLEFPLQNWARLLSDWLCVLADGPNDFHSPFYGGDVYWINEKWNNESMHTEYEAGNVYEPNMIHANEWKYAMMQSSKGQEAPVTRLLLHQAELALVEGHANQSVLHCATATELALAKGLRLRLEELGSNMDVIECVLKRSKMLGERVRLTKELGMTIPKALMKGLVDPRNNVIHRGKRLEIEQGKRAIRLARTVVDEFDPLEDYDPDLHSSEWNTEV